MQAMEYFLAFVISVSAGFFCEAVLGLSIRGAMTRRFLGIRDASKLSIVMGVPWHILPKENRITKDRGMPIFGYGPLRAIQQLSFLLSRAFGRLSGNEIVASTQFESAQLTNDLFLIGFPGANEWTGKVLDSVS